MKTLPIFTSLVLGLTALAWLAASAQEPSPADSPETAQPSAGKADAPGTSPPAPTIDTPGEPSTSEDPQAQGTQSGAQSEAAMALIQEARRRLLVERRSVQAKLRETISMGPRRFRGEGTYVSGSFPKLRLNLAVDVGGTRGELLEICDGHILFTVQKIASAGDQQPEVQVARTVISDVIEALNDTLDVPETMLIAGLGVGGLPALLASLERSMTFEALREIEEGDRTFAVIQGRWSDESLQRLTGGKPDVELSAYIPDHVRIYFDSQTQFPTRILYLRRPSPDSRTFVELLSLEFHDIVLDGQVNDDLFVYTPSSTQKVRERTAEYLQMIDEAARRSRPRAPVRADGSVPIDAK